MYYEYKEWGNTVVVILLNNTDEERELANANPLRYRGYYLDRETGYYYLQSRYYDPSICRFINADSYENVGDDYAFSVNLFAYCLNNPILLSDKKGTDPLIYVYVLYDPDDFSRQATHEKTYWEKNLRYRVVTKKAIGNKSEFINYWNKTIKQDSIVSLIFHGSPAHIRTTSDNFKSGDVNKLNNKRVSQLRILACNCGHKDVKNNIAKQIKKRISKTKTIFAMDGSVSYYPKGHYYEYKYYKPRLSTNQASYYKYVKAKTYRDANGRTHSYLRSPTGLYKI